MEIFGNPITGYSTNYYSKIIDLQSKIFQISENSASVFSECSGKNIYFIYHHSYNLGNEIKKIKNFFRKQNIPFLSINTSNKKRERIEAPWGETYWNYNEIHKFRENLESCVDSKNLI
jgi:hypothetical protein